MNKLQLITDRERSLSKVPKAELKSKLQNLLKVSSLDPFADKWMLISEILNIEFGTKTMKEFYSQNK